MSRVAVVLCLVALTQVCAKAEEQTSKAYAACLDKSGGGDSCYAGLYCG
jgi:hypothetical protein